jgi:hypothetical protein
MAGLGLLEVGGLRASAVGSCRRSGRGEDPATTVIVTYTVLLRDSREGMAYTLERSYRGPCTRGILPALYPQLAQEGICCCAMYSIGDHASVAHCLGRDR